MNENRAVRTVVDFDVRSIGKSMPRERHQRGSLRTSVPAHGGRAKRQLPRGEYWARWYRYIRQPDGSEKRRQREKIITRDLAEKYGIAKDYTGPLNKSDAHRVLDLLIAEDAGTYVPPNTAATVEQVARNYMADMKASWGEHTRRASVNLIETHIIGKIGARRVSDVTTRELQEWLNGYIEGGASSSLLKKLLLYVRAVFDQAQAEEIIRENPARHPRKKLRARSQKRENNRALSAEECRRLLSVLIGRDHLIVRMLIQLGLRSEELFALRPEHVSPDQAMIVDGKTEASEAPVYITPDLAMELRAWIDTTAGPWLFTGKRGKQIDAHNYLSRVIKPAARRAGIEGTVNFQVFRRTCATLFGDKAKDPRVTQAAMRHADPWVTLRHYQQAIPATVKAAALAMEAELGFGQQVRREVQ